MGRRSTGRALLVTPLAVLIAGIAGLLVPSTVSAQRSVEYRQFRVEYLDDGIYFGPAPRKECDFAQLRKLGVRHVIDIRTFKVIASRIEQTRAVRLGFRFERIPTGFFPTKTQTVDDLLRRLETKPCGPIYFHCNLGSDRTGLIAALYRTNTLGWDPQIAFEDWKSDQFNTKLKDLDRYYWRHVRQSVDPSPAVD